jgi:hypothetical protein
VRKPIPLSIPLVNANRYRYVAAMPKPALPEKMTMRFDTGTFAVIDRLVKPGKRAEAIREAVREWIAARVAEQRTSK